MPIQVNLRKKQAFMIFGAILLLSGVFAVYAYNSSPANPSVFGHSANEIEGVCLSDGTNCPSGLGGGSGDVCTLCKDSCGGEYPSYQGKFATDDDGAVNVLVMRGPSCSGSLASNTVVGAQAALCCRSGGSGSSSGVSQIVAGSGITVSPTSGTGTVTLSATSASGNVVGGGSIITAHSSQQMGYSYGCSAWSPASCSSSGASSITCPTGSTVRKTGQIGEVSNDLGESSSRTEWFICVKD